MKYQKLAVLLALLAALLYGLSMPFSKLLLAELSPYWMSSALYLGAGVGMIGLIVLSPNPSAKRFAFRRQDWKYIIAMVILDIIAPILLMTGLLSTPASTTALLNNFEIVFTALVASLFFKEKIGHRMRFAIALIVTAGIVLSVDDVSTLQLTLGSLWIALATLSWGIENNMTRQLSHHDARHVVIFKGLGSGIGALLVAGVLLDTMVTPLYYLYALGVGFVSYGLSLVCYITAQRFLGAARTSAYYAVAPFAGALFSFIFVQESLTWNFLIGAIFMAIATFFLIQENTHQASLPKQD